MMRLITALRRVRAKGAIRKIEIELQGQIDMLAECDDPEIRVAISAARRATRRDLVAARQRYHALLPPGVRSTWRLA